MSRPVALATKLAGVSLRNVTAVLLVGGAVLLASYLPAVRAMRADPLDSLRG